MVPALPLPSPQALHAGFVECDDECLKRFKHSGTTATLAVCVGWELLVANVGDSLAYLDTGAQIIMVGLVLRVGNDFLFCRGTCMQLR